MKASPWPARALNRWKPIIQIAAATTQSQTPAIQIERMRRSNTLRDARGYL